MKYDIDVNSLTQDYGMGHGVFDISLHVEEGKTLGFLGPNGAGKSTTMRHLMGFSRPGSGTCSIGGMDCCKKRNIIQRFTGYLPGEAVIPGDLTSEMIIEINLSCLMVAVAMAMVCFAFSCIFNTSGYPAGFSGRLSENSQYL